MLYKYYFLFLLCFGSYIFSFSQGETQNPGGNAGTFWRVLGNNGTNPATHFIGTVDNQSLVVRTNNTERMRVLTNGNVGIGTTNPAVRLALNGPGVNVYATDMWIENNLHVQGNEGLTQGGRGRLRVGTAWNYVGLYADVSSAGTGNDLVLGASSGIVRVGPNAGSGQQLCWAHSILRDDQGGSIELGGNNLQSLGGIGRPYIDWHVNDGHTRDYDIRIMGTTDSYGPVLKFLSYEGTNLYDYLELDWIGSYDNWADVSAWQYWANASNWLYWDVHNDLDIIDKIKPKVIVNPKTKEMSVVNDPETLPSFISKPSAKNNGQYIFNLCSAISLNTGAIRQLRAENRTYDQGQDARIERLEKIIEDMAGKKLGDITFSGQATIPKNLTRYVVMDGRVSKTSKITITAIDANVKYTIAEQTDGSFAIEFTQPLTTDLFVAYSSTLQ